MKKADLHVHSCFSEHPSEWFLQRLGTRESYTPIETVYSMAMQRGMSFVTITDHNEMSGILELKRKYPSTVFTGVESTTYFPEDGCKIHLLIYGLTQAQFIEIERTRKDIYQLREYLKEQRLAHSVAHATLAINNKLTVDHVYKLLLLFDYFEILNGTRTKRVNDDFLHILLNLMPEHIDDLYRIYRIKPFSDEPWRKGFTGGSDDHSGLRIGETCTTIKIAATPEEFLGKVMAKQSFTDGKSNDYRGFAFSIYKIAWDFSKQKGSGIPATLFSTINRMLFDAKGPGIRNRMSIARIKMRTSKKSAGNIGDLFTGVLDEIERCKDGSVDEKLAAIYERITQLSDELLRSYLVAIEGSIADGDISRLVRALSGILPVAFLSLPFISTINVMNGSRKLQDQLEKKFGIPGKGKRKKIAWFTDTITDLNGPSETIQKCAWLAFYQDYDLIPVACLLPDEKKALLPPNLLDLPAVWSYTPPFFTLYTARIPSFLASIKKIVTEEIDEVLISTPGPVGLLGLLVARLLHIPCRGIYHTDFTEQAACIIGDDTVCRVLEDYVRWFYGMCDEIKVPTRKYIHVLEERGFRADKMSVFRRGIEPDIFFPQIDAKTTLETMYQIPKKQITLLYVGRISLEKRMDTILHSYERIVQRYSDINMVFAGSGPEPYFREFKREMASFSNVFFLGRLKRSQLPLVYSGADLLVFPSTTDTFGMVVLEAQACGLPALVTDVGGPQEIIVNGKTGYVLPANDIEAWVKKISDLVDMMDRVPEQFLALRAASRDHVLGMYDWQNVLNDLFGLPARIDRKATHQFTDRKGMLRMANCISTEDDTVSTSIY